VKNAIEEGLPTYAEGGGFMYLSKAIRDMEGGYYPMAGVYDMEAEMTGRLQRFGYVTLNMIRNNILGEQGKILYGHEFHCSKMLGPEANPAFTVKRPNKSQQWQCGYQYKNCLATYLHIDFYRDPQLITNLIASAQKHIKEV